MRIEVNDGSEEVPDGCSVDELVDRRSSDGRGVAVAVNASVVPRSEWGSTVLQPGDRVEILAAAQGG